VRLNRITYAGVVAIALITAGCSSGTSPSGSTSSQPSSSTTQSNSPTAVSSQTPSTAQGGSLDQATCLDISFAKDNLMVAQKPESARSSADTLEKYGPPDPVKAAIEHFVTTVGAQPNDPDLDANRDLLTNWIKQICPNVNP
jgi:hypothetical protein